MANRSRNIAYGIAGLALLGLGYAAGSFRSAPTMRIEEYGLRADLYLPDDYVERHGETVVTEEFRTGLVNSAANLKFSGATYDLFSLMDARCIEMKLAAYDQLRSHKAPDSLLPFEP